MDTLKTIIVSSFAIASIGITIWGSSKVATTIFPINERYTHFDNINYWRSKYSDGGFFTGTLRDYLPPHQPRFFKNGVAESIYNMAMQEENPFANPMGTSEAFINALVFIHSPEFLSLGSLGHLT